MALRRNDKYRLIIFLCSLILLILLINACAPIKQDTVIRPEEPPAITETAAIPGPEAYYNFLDGFMHEQGGDFKDALVKYEQALSYDENSLFLLSRVASLQAKLGYIDKAIDTMKRLISVAPRPNPCIFLLGEMYFTVGDFERSAETFSQLIEKEPKNVKAYFNRGIALANLKRYDEAIKSIKEGIEIDPHNPAGYLSLGDIYSGKEDFKKAIKNYKKAISISQKDISKTNIEQAYLKMGTVYMKKEDYEKAEDIYQYILANINPFSREALFQLVQIYAQRKEFPMAIEVLEKALGHNPRDMDILFKLSLLYKEIKDYTKAIQKAVIVAAVRPKDLRLHEYLGYLYEETGDYDKARREYETIIEIAPDNIEAHLHLGFIYAKKDDKVNAVPYWKRLSVLTLNVLTHI